MILLKQRNFTLKQKKTVKIDKEILEIILRQRVNFLTKNKLFYYECDLVSESLHNNTTIIMHFKLEQYQSG